MTVLQAKSIVTTVAWPVISLWVRSVFPQHMGHGSISTTDCDFWQCRTRDVRDIFLLVQSSSKDKGRCS